MLDRASTFADPEIVKLLQTRFVPVAIDQFYQRQQKDAEGDFYRKIATQGPWKDLNGTTQGLYIATADGKLLGFNNNRGPERIRALLKQSLLHFSARCGVFDRAAAPRTRGSPTLSPREDWWCE